MPHLIVFNSVSLDGYFTDAHGDVSWAHKQEQDTEWKAFVSDNAKGGGTLLFGRKTYEMMLSYWPTPAAMKNDSIVAEAMNSLPKIVFSNTLRSFAWNNTRPAIADLTDEVRKLKSEPGKDLVVMGSGTIVSQLAQAHLIDELQIVVTPVVLGAGRTLFEGAKEQLAWKLKTSRTFKNGNVLLCYQPRA